MTLPKLIATDLDGTFWQDGKVFDESGFEALLDALDAQGGHFTVATGNDQATVNRHMGKFAGRFDYVIQNGAQVVTKDGQTLAVHSIPVNQAQRVYDVVENATLAPRHGVVFATETNGYMFRQYEGVGEFFGVMASEFPNMQFIDTLQDVPDDILKVIVNWPEEHADAFIQELQAQLGTDAHVTTSGYGAIDVIPANVNKAVGLQTLAEHYGLTLQDMVAFGDGRNDLEMMEVAGQAYAMPNGAQFLLDRFPHAVADNNHSGVMATLRDMEDDHYED